MLWPEGECIVFCWEPSKGLSPQGSTMKGAGSCGVTQSSNNYSQCCRNYLRSSQSIAVRLCLLVDICVKMLTCLGAGDQIAVSSLFLWILSGGSMAAGTPGS